MGRPRGRLDEGRRVSGHLGFTQAAPHAVLERARQEFARLEHHFLAHAGRAQRAEQLGPLRGPFAPRQGPEEGLEYD